MTDHDEQFWVSTIRGADVKDKMGSVIAELNKEGVVKGQCGQSIGIEGFRTIRSRFWRRTFCR